MTQIAKNVDNHVGEKIRDRRIMMGLTQEHLAQALEISYQQVQKYETGANRVSAGRLYEIAQRLEVEISFFFDGIDAKTNITPLEHGGKSRSTIELVRNFGNITDVSTRSAISSLIKSLATPNKASLDEAA